ncbi:MAG: hypothetical protein LBU39_09080 [Desulfobulbaceae bacterium]|nr:hypothetical protein [Desulfobulbaceae bacterium]
MLAIALSAAVPVAAVGVDDTVRHVFVTNTESLSSPAMRLDVESQAIKDKFLADATPIRRALAGKRAALQAVYRARTGDTAAAARLGEEIFDLREQLRLKAQAIGLLPALLMDGEESECAGESRR